MLTGNPLAISLELVVAFICWMVGYPYIDRMYTEIDIAWIWMSSLRINVSIPGYDREWRQKSKERIDCIDEDRYFIGIPGTYEPVQQLTYFLFPTSIILPATNIYGTQQQSLLLQIIPYFGLCKLNSFTGKKCLQAILFLTDAVFFKSNHWFVDYLIT